MNYNRIKEWLAARGKTAKELAERVKKTPQAVSFWNRNITQPDIPTLYEIADFLEIEVSDILTKKSDLRPIKARSNAVKPATKKAQGKISKAKKKG